MVLASKDIEDDVFWRAIFCLLKAIFPAPKALQFCDSNHPAMDKIYFLLHQADCALKKSSSMLDDECLFGSSSRSALTCCNEVLEEIFAETKESYSDKR